MPSVVDQLGSLISSIFHSITAALGSIIAIFQSILSAILGVFQTLLPTVGTAVSGLAHTFEGLVKFLLGNIIVIGSLAAAFVLYTMWQRSNGRPVTAAPAKNKKLQ